MMSANALEAKELFCRRGDRLLFGALDLRLGQGDALHVVGPNGIGKTSLLRMLAGLMPPSPTSFAVGSALVGRVEWAGPVAMLDGRAAIDPDRTLSKALAFWRALDGGAMPLARLGLDGLLDVPVRYLSTGQTRRAALARLIGQGADHWLLDEPLNGLDDQGIRLVEALIAERRQAGGAVVVVSHQPVELRDAIRIDLRDYRA